MSLGKKAACFSLSLLCGCGLFSPREVVVAPDSDLLILEAEGEIRVAAYDSDTNSMVEVGWVDLSPYKGWTLARIDWQELLGDTE